MEEKNKNSLKKAIEGLPKYSPKESLWDDLSNEMNILEGEKALHEAINNLPNYEAPEHLWDNIEAELPKKVRRVWLRPLLAAASVAVLVGLFWINSQPSFGEPTIVVSHSEVPVMKENFVNLRQLNNAQRDSAFRTIIRAQKKESDKAKTILAELEHVNDSKRRLRSRLSKFDVNTDLNDKLMRLEKVSMELQEAYFANI